MPNTPPPSALPPQSTPHSHGTGSNAGHEIHHQQVPYKHYLEVDIAPSPVIPFDEFLSLIFDPQPPQQGNKYDLEKIRTRILKDKEFNKQIKSYAEWAKREEDRYHPFNLLVNRIIELLGQSAQADIVICRNDPAKVLGSTNMRKPDCVVVHRKSMDYKSRESVDNLSEKGPPEQGNFHWSELLAFVEFKLKDNIASPEEAASPPEKAAPPKKAAPQKPKKSVGQSKSAQEKSNSGPSNSGTTREVRNSTRTATASSKVKANHSAFLNTNPVSNRRSASSSKRSGEDSETLSNKQHIGDAEDVEPLIQCASYALEMLSRGGLFTHVLGALVTDGELQLLYYDRSLPIRSQPQNFLAHPNKLIDFVYYMHHASMKTWGRLEKIEQSIPLALEQLDEPLFGCILRLDGGRLVLKLLTIVFIQHALIGRGTCVVRAEILEGPEEWRGEPIVVKFSFTPGTRISEGDLLDDIKKCAEEKNKSILDHLPHVLHHEAFAPGETDVQYRLAEYFENRNGENMENMAMQVDYEKRTLQILVMKELHPIKDLDTADKLIPVIKDIFKCYKWVHETAGVIHRDISENNLMYWKKGDKTICGVLSDYDLSVKLDREYHGPTSKQRTGTRPFMARDLLEPTPMKHVYRHDLESLLYVIVVLMYRSRDQKLEEQERKYTFENFQDLESWFTLGPAELLKEKKAFFSTVLRQAPAAFKKLRVPIMKIIQMFYDGYGARGHHALMLEDNPTKEPLFDETTLGGHVDFDKFEKILDSI